MGRLSLCMIVRDEQEMLPDFLASVAGIWDELIAVDTGSQDQTCRILADAGARILHHQWQNDFSAARNCGLEAASGDWILFLDADERCSPQLGREIRSLLQDPRAGAATLVMRNLRPDGTHSDTDLLRMFRHDPAIRFRHRIHEDPTPDVRKFLKRTGLSTHRLSGVVEHLGYLKNVATGKDKQKRDMGILRSVLKKNPEDMYCWFKLMEQARFWNDEKAWRKAARHCRPHFARALDTGLAQEPWSDEFTALLAQGLHPKPQVGLAWLASLPEELTSGPAVLLRRGLWLEDSGQLSASESAFLACQNAPCRTGTDTIFALRSSLGLCRIKAAQGNLPEAWAKAVEASQACPTDPEALLAAIGFAPTQAARHEWITAHLSRHPEAANALASTLQSCGLGDLAQAMSAVTVP